MDRSRLDSCMLVFGSRKPCYFRVFNPPPMIRTLLLTGSLVLLASAHAQQVQKCCGTSNSTFLLGNTNYARHSQMIYLPGDLTNATDGPITHLYFRYGSTGQDQGNTMSNFMVRLGLTDETAFANGNEYFTDLDVVYSASSFTIAPGTTGEWLWFSLQTPFLYNTGRTLIVDITFESSTTVNFGTLGTTNNGRKLVSPDLGATTGSVTSSTWQDIGFDIDGTLGLSASGGLDVELWPNPATSTSILRWSGGTPTPSSVDLHDINGRLVRTTRVPTGAQQCEIDVHDLDPGLYLLRWGGTRSARLVVD